VEKIKKGDRFIKPSRKKIYIVKKVILNGDWAVLKEENGDHQILAPQESLRRRRKWKKDRGEQFTKSGMA
jgi:hypothetical protein